MVFFSIAAPFRLPNVSFAELGSLLCGPCAGALTVVVFRFRLCCCLLSMRVSFNAYAETFLGGGKTLIASSIFSLLPACPALGQSAAHIHDGHRPRPAYLRPLC